MPTSCYDPNGCKEPRAEIQVSEVVDRGPGPIAPEVSEHRQEAAPAGGCLLDVARERRYLTLTVFELDEAGPVPAMLVAATVK